jgi:hypothetical protein
MPHAWARTVSCREHSNASTAQYRILQGFTELGASDLQQRPVRPRLRFRGSRPT